jgi:2'-5' RNA ligase
MSLRIVLDSPSEREMSKAKKDDNREASIRTFVCIEIPESIRRQIGDLQNGLRRVEAHVSWVKVENIHLTLKFLGSISPARLAKVCEAVERVTRSRSPFDVEVSGAGCFPSRRNPRILWAGITISAELTDLHAALESELAKLGFERESRKFSPHLTIGRLRSTNGSNSLADAIAKNSLGSYIFSNRQVVVMRSDLHPSGSVYTPQSISHLGVFDQ